MKQVAVGRLAKVLMKGLVVAAGFAAGISGWADSAQNSFIKVEGDVKFGDVSDEEIIITDPPGPKTIIIQGREGWNPDEPQIINIPAGGSATIPVDGKDGENNKKVVIKDKSGEGDPPPPPLVNPPGGQDQPGDTTPPGDENQDDQEDTAPDENPPKEDCSHTTNMVPEHASSPTIAPKEKTANVVAIYSCPEIGVPVPKEIEFEEHTEGTHAVYAVISACEKCGAAEQKFLDHNATIHATEEYRHNCIAEGAVEGADGRKYLPYGKHEVKYTAYWEGSDCRENKCHCSADGYRKYFVYLAGLTSPEYIGLDMTDEGKKTWKEYEASASITPDEDRSKTVSWELVSNHSVFEDGTKSAKTDGEPVKFGGLKKDPTPSENYRGETIRAMVTLPDAKGGNGSATVTNAFTVVQVDVKIAKGKENGNGDEKGKKNVEAKDVFVDEDREESEGAYLYHVPDAIGTLWTQEGTNALKQVVFSVMPNDLPKDQKVTIDVRKGLLFEKKDGQYKPAKSSYTLEELAKVTFWLHGHDRSEEYLGDSITLTHDLSGAKDVAKFTIFGRPWLVPDYDRDGKIDDADEAKAKDGKTVFRFWINNDNDKGDACDNDQYTRDTPGEGKNYKSKTINGRNDLEDFTPIWIDLSEVFPEGTPENLKNSLTLKLESKCINAVWTEFNPGEAGLFLRKDCICSHNEKTRQAVMTYENPVDMLADGKIPTWFLEDMIASPNGKGVFLLEGKKDGDDVRLSCKFAGFEIEAELACQISDVSKMYRWMSLRGVCGEKEKGDDHKTMGDPENRPDAECDETNYVFVHGFNVNQKEAKANGAEVFKRLWQSGLKSKFTVVDWRGNDEQFKIPIRGTVDLNYFINAVHAFASASSLVYRCSHELPPGPKVMLAHSLGNMLVSSACVDWHLPYSKYYLFDAAVAQEAYDPTAYEETMIEKEWKAVKPEFRSSRWYELFRGNQRDFRYSLTWKGRFDGIKNAVNCYAKTEDVVGNKIDGMSLSQMPVWPLQETVKGCLKVTCINTALNILSFYTRTWSTIEKEGGWGFEHRDYMVSESSTVSRKKMIENPMFTHFCIETQNMHSEAPYIIADKAKYDALRAKFLSDAIPAESFAVGANKTDCFDGNVDMDLARENQKAWVRDKDNNIRWLHNDMKNAAYMCVYKLYDMVVKLKNDVEK